MLIAVYKSSEERWIIEGSEVALMGKKCVCAWRPVKDWRLIQVAFPLHTRCSQHRLQIHCDSDQDKEVTERK